MTVTATMLGVACRNAFVSADAEYLEVARAQHLAYQGHMPTPSPKDYSQDRAITV